MAEASGRNRRLAPALAARAGFGINDLPDEVLLRVMSHLSTRRAVRTCVLSRRWRDLWRSVPRINVSCYEFDDGDRTDEESEVLFKRFVNRLLMLRDPVGLDEFRLQYSLVGGQTQDDLDANSTDANLWIGHALQCNAGGIEVVNRFEPLQLVPGVFTSKYLKSLHISSATLIHGFFGQLHKGCPELKDLFLFDCLIMDTEVTSQTLKVLTLDDEVRFVYDRRASISAPSLISLIFLGPYGFRLPWLSKMASLEKASILISEEIDAIDAIDVRQFLECLSDVRRLEFYYDHRELTMPKNYQWCPKFSNLTNLTLDQWCVHEKFYALIVFLQNSPSLKKLTLKLNQLREHRGRISAIVGELKGRSFTCDQLEIVEIICSERDNPLLSKVETFLLASGITPDQIHILAPTQRA